jgi:regulator of protease activity HflC (stomatin/prohibitin superfamily)
MLTDQPLPKSKKPTQNLLPLDAGLVLRLRIVNPQKALFSVENWLETVINMVQPAVRFVISTDTYENWIRQPKDLGDEVFKRLEGWVVEEEGKPLVKTGRDVVGELRSLYGIEMISFGVKSFDPSPEESLDEVRRATLKKYLAQQEKTRIITEAQGKKQEAKLLGQGEAAGIGAVQSLGKDAMQLRAIEVMASKGNTTFVLPGDGKGVSLILPSQEKPGQRGPDRRGSSQEVPGSKGPNKKGPAKDGPKGEES